MRISLLFILIIHVTMVSAEERQKPIEHLSNAHKDYQLDSGKGQSLSIKNNVFRTTIEE